MFWTSSLFAVSAWRPLAKFECSLSSLTACSKFIFAEALYFLLFIGVTKNDVSFLFDFVTRNNLPLEAWIETIRQKGDGSGSGRRLTDGDASLRLGLI